MNSVEMLQRHKTTEARIVSVLFNALKAKGVISGPAMHSVKEWRLTEAVAGAVLIDVVIAHDTASGMTTRREQLLFDAAKFEACFQ